MDGLSEESPARSGDIPAVYSGSDAEKLPLVVDLDGTLVATDTLFEGLLSLIRHHPGSIFLLPVWLGRGRAALKSEVMKRVALDAGNLPYRRDLVEYLGQERAEGRRIVLATAAYHTIAESVAGHLGVFDEVLASTDSINLKGPRKREELVRRFGLRGFDYVGDSRADEAVWEACRIAHVAGSLPRVPAAVLETGTRQGYRFSGPRAGLRTWTRAIRVHQWVKNVLVFAPALLNHHVTWEILTSLILTFMGFSLVASGTYLANDLFDLEADRRHPRKRRRPLASGQVPIAQGSFLAVCLQLGGLACGLLVSRQLALGLLVYLILTTLYSSFLKGKPVLDVVLLAALYTLRVYMGGLVSQAYVSPWLFQFSIFLFLSLAFVKRYSELLGLPRDVESRSRARGYRFEDLTVISQAGVGSGLLAGLVLALYINGQEIERLYPRPQMLWVVCPLFVYWIIRVWLIAHRGNMRDDPILFAFRDRVSYIVGLLIAGAALLGLAPHV